MIQNIRRGKKVESQKRFRRHGRKKPMLTAAGMAGGLLLCVYFLQHCRAHADGYFVPDYPRVVLTKETDYETFYLQTGLGKSAVDKLLAEGDFRVIQEVQDAFFQPPAVVCEPLLGWFTREDRIGAGPKLIDLQPGDIILTLSTHSFGWRHGHVGLVIDEDTILESMVIGKDSSFGNPGYWREYSDYCVLRVKNITPQVQKDVADYASSTLHGVPYHLTSGFIGAKAPEPDAWQFGLQCAYLAWYAWNHFGYDLDSDSGRLVSAYDLLQSGLLEVVQVYGMDPRERLYQ